jgi:hypothetical protein
MAMSSLCSIGSSRSTKFPFVARPINDLLDAYYMSYFSLNADNFDTNTKTWLDLSYNKTNKTFTGTTSPSAFTYNQNDTSCTTTKSYRMVKGFETDICTLFPISLTNYTFIAVSRLPFDNGKASSMFSAPGPYTNTWSCGYWVDRAGVCMHNGVWAGTGTSTENSRNAKNRYSANTWLLTDTPSKFRRN